MLATMKHILAAVGYFYIIIHTYDIIYYVIMLIMNILCMQVAKYAYNVASYCMYNNSSHHAQK